jgi:hypothetical protein
MDPVSTAIIAAATAGVLDGVKNTAGTALADAYAGLRGLIVRKFGADAPVVTALAKYEDASDSKKLETALLAILAESRLAEDGEIVAAAGRLQQITNDVRIQVNIHGDGNVVAKDSATVTMTNTFNR